MRVLYVSLLLLGSVSLAWADGPVTWDGFVTDTHCGTNCQRTSAMTPDKACVKRCVEQGSKYGLWYGKSVYVLQPQAEAAKFAAENVRVTGDLVDGTIHIRSIVLIPGQKAAANDGKK
jgi:hypothetical protein